MNDSVLVLGWIWAAYLAVRLLVEAGRWGLAERAVAAAAARPGDEDATPARRRSARRAWTPLPAAVWLATEAAVAAVCVGVAWLVLRDLSVNVIPAGWAAPLDVRRAAVATIVGWSLVVVNVPVAWRLVNLVLPSEAPRRVSTGVDPERMGETIGVLERLLVVVLVPSGGPAAVGFVVAAKTLARFKELDKKRFAERYLLGTMTSVTVALTSALAAMWIWSSVA